MDPVNIDELIRAGLLDDATHPHLTDKGRDWLQALTRADGSAKEMLVDPAEDLVLSTNGIFR